VTEIPVFYNPNSSLHHPKFELFNGEKRPYPDIPERLDVILTELRTSGFADIQIAGIEGIMPLISKVHTTDYIDFLSKTSQSAKEQAIKHNDPDRAIYPNVHPYIPCAKASSAVARRGLYVYDMYTPITSSTYEAAIGAVGVAIAGSMLLQNGESLVYSLTRPSGHHTLTNMTGGMCYLNNAAIAANFLKSEGSRKVAIFDIDLHHGNGTQEIFYQDPKVLVVNIHIDPQFKFPHFTGYVEEKGEGDGYGTNYNFPLPLGTDSQSYDDTATAALQIIKSFQPEYLIVSAGFDTHEKDSSSTFKLTTSYYELLGKKIKKLDLPTLVIQEGGYTLGYLGLNVVSFLKGLIRR